MDQKSIDSALGSEGENGTLAALVSAQAFDFDDDVIFSRSYPEPGQHYDMAGRTVRVELVISRVSGSIEFVARVRYSDTNRPVLMEAKTKNGKPVDNGQSYYDPELEEIESPRLIGEEVNFGSFENLDFSYSGLKSFAEANGIDSGMIGEHNSLFSAALEIRQKISKYWKDNGHIPKKVKIKTTNPLWKKVDELEARAKTIHAEEMLRKAGYMWISTFPDKVKVFIENDGRAAGQGPYLQNWVRIAHIPRTIYLGTRYL